MVNEGGGACETRGSTRTPTTTTVRTLGRRAATSGRSRSCWVRAWWSRAGCAIVPFSAFGDSKNRACLPRLRDALRALGG